MFPTAMLQPFDACWERISRARSHRQAIAKLWNDFLQEDEGSGPWLPGVHVDSLGKGTIWLEQTRDLPGDLALELGEFLYQLRAALDSCIYEAACLVSGQRPPPNEQDLEFPISDSAVAFRKSRWHIRPLERHRELVNVIETVQPYLVADDLPAEALVRSPNRALGMLHDWARKDRHRKLHIIGSWASNIAPLVVVAPPARVVASERPPQGLYLKEETVILTFKVEGWQAGMSARVNPRMTIDLAIDESPPPAADSDTLGWRLKCMTVVVGEVVATVSRALGVEPPETSDASVG